MNEVIGSALKAFWFMYQLETKKMGMSTLVISRQYGIHQESAWFFKPRCKVKDVANYQGLYRLMKQVLKAWSREQLDAVWVKEGVFNWMKLIQIK